MKAKKKVIKRKDSVKENKATKKNIGYFKFSWPFMALIFVLGVAMLATMEFGLIEAISFHPLGVLALVTTFVAGCSAVKNNFKVKQTAVIGVLCFLAIFWTIPYIVYFHFSSMPITTNYLVLNLVTFIISDLIANLVIYVLVALIGGFISSRVN